MMTDNDGGIASIQKHASYARSVFKKILAAEMYQAVHVGTFIGWLDFESALCRHGSLLYTVHNNIPYVPAARLNRGRTAAHRQTQAVQLIQYKERLSLYLKNAIASVRREMLNYSFWRTYSLMRHYLGCH